MIVGAQMLPRPARLAPAAPEQKTFSASVPAGVVALPTPSSLPPTDKPNAHAGSPSGERTW